MTVRIINQIGSTIARKIQPKTSKNEGNFQDIVQGSC